MLKPVVLCVITMAWDKHSNLFPDMMPSDERKSEIVNSDPLSRKVWLHKY